MHNPHPPVSCSSRKEVGKGLVDQLGPADGRRLPRVDLRSEHAGAIDHETYRLAQKIVDVVVFGVENAPTRPF